MQARVPLDHRQQLQRQNLPVLPRLLEKPKSTAVVHWEMLCCVSHVVCLNWRPACGVSQAAVSTGKSDAL